jgi:hypothetical protein
MGLSRRIRSDTAPERPCTTFWVAVATPSMRPITLPLAPRVWMRNTGRTG